MRSIGLFLSIILVISCSIKKEYASHRMKNVLEIDSSVSVILLNDTIYVPRSDTISFVSDVRFKVVNSGNSELVFKFSEDEIYYSYPYDDPVIGLTNDPQNIVSAKFLDKDDNVLETNWISGYDPESLNGKIHIDSLIVIPAKKSLELSMKFIFPSGRSLPGLQINIPKLTDARFVELAFRPQKYYPNGNLFDEGIPLKENQNLLKYYVKYRLPVKVLQSSIE